MVHGRSDEYEEQRITMDTGFAIKTVVKLSERFVVIDNHSSCYLCRSIRTCVGVIGCVERVLCNLLFVK